jgi:hypothetical protein
MGKNIDINWRNGIVAVLLMAMIWAGGTFLGQDSQPAFGGAFPGQMTPQGPRYQIAGCDASSAWVIDSNTGDVYLIYSNGKWKDVGSIMDDKKQIRGKN